MWFQYGLEHAEIPSNVPVGLTIGAFDGVHLGHQTLIRRMVAGAHAAGYRAIVLTFDPLPRQFFRPGEPTLLSSLDERLTYLRPLGVDGVIVHPFDAQTVARSAQDFITALTQSLWLRGLWIGADFTLGHAREGDVTFLRQAGQRLGFTVHTLTEATVWGGAAVHSSRIRHALRAGYVTEARACLGRPYMLSGTVGHGEQRGRTLGFPTANLDVPISRLRPANGVYITHVHLPHGTFRAITNVGIRPTFNHRPPTVEAYILDFSDDIYDAPMQVDFLHRLRPEVQFPSADALITQMRRDEADTRAWFATNAVDLQHGSVAVEYMADRF